AASFRHAIQTRYKTTLTVQANPYDSPSEDNDRTADDNSRGSSGLTTLRLAIISVFAIAAAFVFIATRPAFDRKLLSRVRPGITRTEVSTLLGPPHNSDGRNQWEYSRWGNAGWVEVQFDANGTVIWINDESVFPP
ncbi:MAG: hypothetical protein AAF989_17660, partial [Planctomycetota bacterium]